MTHTITINNTPVPVPDGPDRAEVHTDFHATVSALKLAIEARGNAQSAATTASITLPAQTWAVGKLTTGNSIKFTGFSARPVVVGSFQGYAVGQYLQSLHLVESWSGGVLTVQPAVYCHHIYTTNSPVTLRVALVAHSPGTGTTFAASDDVWDENTQQLVTPTIPQSTLTVQAE